MPGVASVERVSAVSLLRCVPGAVRVPSGVSRGVWRGALDA